MEVLNVIILSAGRQRNLMLVHPVKLGIEFHNPGVLNSKFLKKAAAFLPGVQTIDAPAH